MQGALNREGEHLDSLLTLTNMPLSGPKTELRGCVYTVCRQVGKSSCGDPWPSALYGWHALPCPLRRQSEVKVAT